MEKETYEDFLYESLEDANEEIKNLKQIIEALKEEELYTSNLVYDWDENAHEVYEPFDVDEFIKEKKLTRR